MRELEIPISLQGESRGGKMKYGGRTKDGAVIVLYVAEPLSEPVSITAVPLEYLLRQRKGTDRNRKGK